MTSPNKGGRPPRIPGETLKRVNLSLAPGSHQALGDIAEILGVSLSQAAEWAISEARKSFTPKQVAALRSLRAAREAMT